MKEVTELETGSRMKEPIVDLKELDAFILDMDGVVTNTARVHAIAWKQTFDEFLQDRSRRTGERFEPFDEKVDYLSYVDGKPRCDGVKSFLDSRHISLPFGGSEDPPDMDTVCGIGNRKNERFYRWLEDHGAESYPSTVDFILKHRSEGYRFALISASRNARKVLQAAGLSNLFEVVVDGVVAAELGLKGKPAPDIFLEAARRLNVPPGRSAVIEDSLAGVEAGKAGNFALVIGVDRGGQDEELRKHGADVVVDDLIALGTGERAEEKSGVRLPSALDHLDEIFKQLRKGIPSIFLDYDGTLTPIVKHPSEALITEEMRDVVQTLAMNCLVSIISGRDLADVRKMVGLNNLAYAGSHGFEMVGPRDSFHEQEVGSGFLPTLDATETELRSAVKEVKGAWVDRKRFALALHYREVDPKDVARLESLFREVARGHKGLKATGGKKVFELRPNMDWDKGKAVLRLLERLHVDGSQVVPLYIGDDVTDEDAFRTIGDRGITILVSDRPQETAAKYGLTDVGEVLAFLSGLVEHFESEVAIGVWALNYDRFDPEQEKLRETLCTTGNGYFASRGAAPESTADAVHYPGTYLAGVYDRLVSQIGGRTIENESMVNIPNWLFLSFRINGGERFDLQAVEILDYHQELDMRCGTLKRTVRFIDRQQRQTKLSQRRFVSMDSPHIAGLETTITPENWAGSIQILSALDGMVKNELVERYNQLNNDHLEQVGKGTNGEDTIWLQVMTKQSHIRVTEAARTRIFKDAEIVEPKRGLIDEPRFIGQVLDVPMESGRSIRIEKIVSIYSSRDRAISESATEALHELSEAGDFGHLWDGHKEAWKQLWGRFHIRVDVDHGLMAEVLNLHIFHLLQTVSPHSIDLDVGVPPRGLHGEAYRGLIMWDEIFIFPFLSLRIPDLTRSLLMYRYRRLPWARWAAGQSGLRGAMFPWQSGSDGKEEAQSIHLNPMSGQWIPDYSLLERHINLAIVYNVWQYYQVSGDLDFMSYYGADLMIEIARFWASKARYNGSSGRYEILNVMGPDEFHEKYPDSMELGINNNAYTNVMATWLFCRTLDMLRLLPLQRRKDVVEEHSLSEEELDHWDEISRKMFVPFHGSGIISQFEGYENLKELDWEKYRREYGNIHRLDRILKAEGDSPDRYKVSKQADVLMLFYLLSSEELHSLFDHLGYQLGPETIQKTIDYYMERTSHGSTLSRVVHAWVLSRLDRERSWHLFLDALRSDVSDIQGGTTTEGIHLGAMAGTVDIVQRCYSGLETREDVLWFSPRLPQGLKRLRFEIEYRRHWLKVEISKDVLQLASRPQEISPISIGFKGKVQPLAPGDTVEFDLK